MKYDFTSILDRRGMDAIAVAPETDPFGIAPKGVTRPGFDQIPMWVADMNYPTAPTIIDAMVKRSQHPAFGYFVPSDEYYESILRWQTERNHVEGLKREHIGYQNGVVGGIISALQTLCSMGDNILIHAPAYAGFTDDIGRCGYKLNYSYLIPDEEGIWRMDFGDMERQIKAKNIHTAIFCSPHNPTGRVWEKWEIEKAMEIFERNEVIVLSDEIWSDLTLYGSQHIPTQSVSEYAKKHTIAFYAPSKTFNLAGLIGAYSIVYNKYLRDRLTRQSAIGMYNQMNVISMHALIGSYKPEAEEWVAELREVLGENSLYAYNYIKEHFEGVEVSRPQGTYMMFLDVTKWCEKHQKTLDELLESGVEVGVLWQDGRQFMAKCAIRLNLAVPHSRVVEAFDRLDKYVFNA